jgi:AmmeMemoRadiSam system protein B
MSVRRAAVAGSWYPDDPARLRSQVQAYLTAGSDHTRVAPPDGADVFALIAPHAGLMYSGPVAAHAYRLLQTRTYDVIVLVGPSHYVSFEGVSIWRSGSFETPLGELRIDEETSAALATECAVVEELPAAHQREHSLEMQLPFLAVLAPEVPIVPLVMGRQTRATAFGLADCLARALKDRRALLVASSDLSHFFDRKTAAFLDAQVVEHVDGRDADGLMARLEQRPDHACGGGPMVSVIRAASAIGAVTSRVLHYADSGDVSGDTQSVVGYLAAALWK